MFIEMDNGVFAASAVSEVAQDRWQIGFVAPQQFHYLLNPEFVEINPTFAPTNLEKSFQHLFQEWICDGHHVSNVLSNKAGAVSAFAHRGPRDGGGEQTVSDRLRI